MSEPLTGHCLCGAVRYRVTGPVDGPIACHCRACQRQSGSFWVAVSAPLDAVEIVDDRVGWVAISPKARRGFCRDCGGFLFWQPTDGRSIDIAFGTLDDTQGLKLTSHIHVAEARLTLPRDGLPHHDAGLPEDDAG